MTLVLDSTLVQEARKNPDAFSQIVERYEQKFMRYVHRLTGACFENIQDILQETFIKMYRNLNDFDDSLSFSSWAYRIAHNEAINFLRSHKNGASIVPLETDDEDALNLIELLESDSNTHAEVAREELKSHVGALLRNLKPEFRDVLVLRYLEEKDYEEISDIIKKPAGTVATLLNRAKAQFKMLAVARGLDTLINTHE